jgi:hypothetical protein
MRAAVSRVASLFAFACQSRPPLRSRDSVLDFPAHHPYSTGGTPRWCEPFLCRRTRLPPSVGSLHARFPWLGVAAARRASACSSTGRGARCGAWCTRTVAGVPWNQFTLLVYILPSNEFSGVGWCRQGSPLSAIRVGTSTVLSGICQYPIMSTVVGRIGRSDSR